MEWYYADNGRQVGPVNERDVERLVKEGKITANTLVWKRGLTDWQQYGDVTRHSAGSAPRASRWAIVVFAVRQPVSPG